MLVEIHSNDSGSGMNTTLTVYRSYNEQQKLFELRPICTIDESDFCEILTDKQIDKMYSGQIHFRVNKNQLLDKSKRMFHH